MTDSSRQTASSKLSEAEFLRLEAEKAKAAIALSLRNAKTALEDNVDPRAITRRHPWLALASAALAGFVTASVVFPSKEDQEIHRLERIRLAMNPDPPAPASMDSNGAAKKNPPKHSIGEIILHELIQVLKPVLMTAITSSIKSGANPPPSSPPPMEAPSQGPDEFP
jgi:hypothetical protein